MSKSTILRFIIILILATILVLGLKHFGVRITFIDHHKVVHFNPSSNDTTHYPLLPDSDIRNIILFIGDGMGISQITAARIKTVGPNGRLNIERMPVTGLVCSHSIDDLITDSAAAATALATGFKTKNRMVAMTPDRIKLLTILEAARDSGLSTGLVVTSTITHATPACFASHILSRYDYATIAEQLLNDRVNVLFGGGKRDFIPKSWHGSKRSDEINLITTAQALGYQFIQTKDELQLSTGNYLLGLFQLGPLKTKPPEPTLAELTKKAIEILNQNEKGFFLMVEGSKIDWAGHRNDFEYLIQEVLMFDEAVKVGLDFAMKDKHTLTIVTADHETGGLNITDGNIEENEMEINWMTTGHTGTPIPLFAFGPNALKFTGIKDNTDIPKIFAKLLGIHSFPRKLF